MVVEDELLVSMVVEEALKGAGYEVAAVHDGSAALETLEKGVSHVEAIIADIRLGGSVTGWDIARRARELAPEIPVVYASGDSAGDWSEHGVNGSMMLSKPFSMKRVIDVLALIMASKQKFGLKHTSS